MGKKEIQAYDIYLIRTSGIPLFAGCTQSDYCMSHLQQHELQAGFLAAINAFSKEAFEDEKIHTIYMDNIQINFIVNEEDGLIFAVLHDINADTDFIKRRLKDAYDIFISRFPEAKDENHLDVSQFEEVTHILRQLGLVGNKLGNTLEMQLIEKRKQSKRGRLMGWIRGIISPSY
ncbi:MAG: hypothetical protein D6732_16310 [Methanobacteriota archaeon]|nr:MAG: hypothetical protein D6732_16310 [Euryarchaeota archaeon]